MNDPIIEAVLKREGGDTPLTAADHGGLTRFGITRPFLHTYGTEGQTVENLTVDDARAVYAAFMKATRIGDIVNDDLRGVVFDAAVLSGSTAAIKTLQRALGVRADGIIGNVTLAALPHLDGRKLALLFLCDRIDFLAAITAGNLEDRDRDGIPDNLEMLRGWIRRATDQVRGLA